MKTRLIIVATCALALAVAGCAGVADFLESPANDGVLDIASTVTAGFVSSQIGTKVTPEQNQIITDAAKAAIKTSSKGAVYWFAEWLRSLQSTKHDVNTNMIATQVTDPVIAAAPAKLNNTGVPADVANEAVALTLQTVAAHK